MRAVVQRCGYARVKVEGKIVGEVGKGIIALIGFLLRKKFSKNTLDFYLVKTSFRQSFLFSFLITTVLFMLAEHIFSWLNILILIIILSIIEYLLINKK